MPSLTESGHPDMAKPMKVKDFDELAYPRRRPWWILIVGVVAIGFFLVYRRSRPPDTGPGEPEQTTASGDISHEVSPPPDMPGQKTEAAQKQPPDTGNVLPPDTGDVMSVVKRADTLRESGQLVAARSAYENALRRARNASLKHSVEEKLGTLNVELVMNPYEMPEKEEYSVRSGDSVDRIARRFGTTKDLVALSNRIKNPNLIKTGDRLRVFKGKFEVTVSKAQNDLVVTMDKRFFKRYRVGTGEFSKTPVGTFKINLKQKEPDWWTQGRRIRYGTEENILGTRWMAIQATGETPAASGYGIHGTWDPDSVGKSLSAGCVRLLNAEVEELYALLPLGTAVTITE